MVDRLDESQYKMLREAFSLLDIDGDGLITAGDVQTFLLSFNESFSGEDIEEMLKEYTVEQKPRLDFAEFLIMMSQLVSKNNPEVEASDRDLLMTFQAMDSGNKGYLTVNDVRAAVDLIGENWDDEQVNEMIYHKKKDGRMTFPDFKQMIRGRK